MIVIEAVGLERHDRLMNGRRKGAGRSDGSEDVAAVQGEPDRLNGGERLPGVNDAAHRYRRQQAQAFG